MIVRATCLVFPLQLPVLHCVAVFGDVTRAMNTGRDPRVASSQPLLAAKGRWRSRGRVGLGEGLKEERT